MATTRDVQNKVKNAEHSARPWELRLARIGYAAKGIVYLVLGLMAFQAATGVGSPNVDTRNVLLKIITQPMGKYLITFIGIGLLCYVAWRVVESLLDPENEGSKPKGLAIRVGYLASAVTYAGIALACYQLVSGTGSGAASSSQAPKDFTARLLAISWGHWVVIAAGIIMVGAALYQMYYAYKAGFTDHLRLTELRMEERKWAIRSGQFGTAARAVVYLLIGFFLIQAGTMHDPSRAGGLGDALATLARQPYGPWLLGIVALGLMAYGVFSEIMAKYYRMNA